MYVCMYEVFAFYHAVNLFFSPLLVVEIPYTLTITPPPGLYHVIGGDYGYVCTISDHESAPSPVWYDQFNQEVGPYQPGTIVLFMCLL